MALEFAHQHKRSIGYLVCAAGFALTVFAFYPGMMSPDSIASLAEGRSGMITDQNSAIMSFIWSGLDPIVAGPGLMLILQAAVFWVAIACLWEGAFRESLGLGIALVLFPFLPQILSQLPVIWKDVLMATALLAAVALVYLGKKLRSKIALVLSVPFLMLGLAARLNALPAVVPIAIWTAFVVSAVLGIQTSRFVSLATGAAYAVILLVGVIGLQSLITNGRTAYPFQYVQLYDLAAISIATGEPRFPGYVVDRAGFSMESVRNNYTSTTVGRLVYDDQVTQAAAPPLAVVFDAERIGELRSTWMREIWRSPGAYLAHRTAVFAELIGLRRSIGLQFWDLTLSRNPNEYAIGKNVPNQVLTRYFGFFQRPVTQTFFFRGVIWILACGYLTYRATKAKFESDWDLVLVLSASSLLYIFSYFFTAPAADFRYIYWPAIGSVIAVIFGIYLIRSGKVERTAEV